jgi:prepilin-type N-terminal cleavage/methylation domain-containing protein
MLRRSSNGGLHRSGGLAAPMSRCGRDEGGFSLLEILVVLALCGLISALLLGGGSALLRTVTTDDVQNTALGAIAGARHSAVLTGRTLEFTANDRTRVLDWGEGRAALAGEGAVRLLPVVRSSASLVGGQLVEAPLLRVRFYADGTCDPFRLEIVRGNTSQILNIDPWTCTVLSPEAGPGHR